MRDEESGAGCAGLPFVGAANFVVSTLLERRQPGLQLAWPAGWGFVVSPGVYAGLCYAEKRHTQSTAPRLPALRRR